jgi:hypothetical protein
MTTIAPARTDEYVRKVSGHSRPTSEAEPVSSDRTVAEALLERLIFKTTTANGIDRETLLNLDNEAWGI